MSASVDWADDRCPFHDRSALVNRYRLPGWINSLIDRIADAPMSPIGRIAARRMGAPAPAGAVPATEFDDKPIRVLITPMNYSGQGRAWARALEAADPSISARNTAVDVPGGFSFDADLVVPVGTYHNGAEWQQREFEAASRATHVLIEAEEPPFGRMLSRSVAAQAEALLDRGVDVAFLAHGTDVRLPSRHMTDNPWSHYGDPDIYAPRAEVLAARNIRLLTESGRPLFVSTPDLLEDLPSAGWCPVVVDPSRWAAAPRSGSDGPLRVTHVPSVSAVKGTQLILPALEKLAEEGVIDLRLVQGVPSAEMPAVFATADVVIDQVRIGSYGVAACEAMAAGCIVVGHVADRVRGEVERRTGLALPVVESDPPSIEETLRRLAALPDRSAIIRAGIDFVRHVHDGRMAAAVLTDEWIRPRTSTDQEGGAHASRD
ncbi:hypothetical protein [Microbacterium sp. TPD7012]|uniref:hypothetical protein n=1 Tax=unclassified Microbacterium TaxID=2609290 RepID=UPI000D508E48|nr:hypothetical protein [Microbacterium sp. TPD7012]PVE92210.1 hypothetical protein DC434_16985 [Microbacterium sp. TPD7012]